jgi:hypothetical protein
VNDQNNDLVCNFSIIILKLNAVVENRESKMQSGQLKVEELKRNLAALETKSKTQTEYLARETKVI